MNNKKLEVFKVRLNDFRGFTEDVIEMANDGNDKEKKVVLDYISRITSSNGKSFEDFNFLDFLNTINEFSGDITNCDFDLSWSMYINLQEALYNYIYMELIKNGLSREYLESLEGVYEGSWGKAENGFWIEYREFFGEVVNYTITPELLTNDELLIKSLDEIVDNIYTKIK